MTKVLFNAFLTILICTGLATPALAGDPCGLKAQKHQLDVQKHQLDAQRRQIGWQYPGPANAAYRESLMRQLDAQRRELDFEKHQLDHQKKQCKAPHGGKYKHHKHDKDRDRD